MSISSNTLFTLLSMTFSPTYSFDVLVEATVDAASPRILPNLQYFALAATCPFCSQSLSAAVVEYTAYCLLCSLVEHSCINSKSLTFGYLDEKPIDTGLMKFLGLCPSTLSWYLEFAFAFSTSLAHFTTNALPPQEQGIDDSTKVPPLRYYGATKPIALLSIALHLHPFLRDR
ncbi:hypothetical protein BHE74_00035785 [Ensete ventricosum]|nr:hypothetical protein GW17_00052393 [Ensete ventricosum]RWW57428.1 hypothetical protein BHE74_00035785 [Ensete ventricosum]